MEIDEEAYAESFRPHMMDVVYEWCNGCSFSKICKMTDIFEGNLDILYLPSFCADVFSFLIC